MIKMLFFDMDGVLLFGGFKDFLKILEKEIGIPFDELWERIYRNIFPEFTAGKIDGDEYWKRAIKELDLTYSVQELDKMFFDTFRLNQEFFDFAKSLDHEYRKAVLSNSAKSWLDKRMNKFNLYDYFEAYYSEQVGFNKDDKEFFPIVLKKVGLKAEECLLIDDQDRNLVYAREMGMKTILLKNNTQAIKDLKKVLDRD